jgi:hypothetical protein
MVVFGFLISFVGVGGPRAVGLAGGMQLMLTVALAAGRLQAKVLARAGDLLLAATAGLLTAGPSTADRPVLSVADRATVDRAENATALAAASYDMYQAERHSPAESSVDRHGILVVGQQILRGPELLRAGTLSPGRRASRRATSRPSTTAAWSVNDWLSGIRDDLAQVARTSAAPRVP